MVRRALAAQKAFITTYIWLVLGGVIGLLAAGATGSTSFILRLENIGVGIFGAFIGGEFLVAMFAGPNAAKGFNIFALFMAVVGAVVMLVLLALMRKAVGPLRSGKSRQRNG